MSRRTGNPKNNNFMRKYLHIEKTKHGFYIYVDRKKKWNRKTKEVTLEQIDEECCIASSDVDTEVVIDVSRLVDALKKDEKKGLWIKV